MDQQIRRENRVRRNPQEMGQRSEMRSDPRMQQAPNRPQEQRGAESQDRRSQMRPEEPEWEVDERQATRQTAPAERSSRERRDSDNIDTMLNRLEEYLNNARKVPFSESCIVDRDEFLYLVRMIREALPEELRQSRWLLQNNKQLIVQARKEQEKILQDAEKQMARMIDEHEITQQAQIEARALLDEANAQSRQIHNNAMNYARELLAELEEQLTDMLVFIQKNKKDLDA